MTARRWMLALLVSASLAVGACSTVIPGTPVAEPGATGAPSAAPTRTAAPPTTARPTTPRPGGPPQGLAATTCGDYIDMDEATKRQVIDAIGEQNDLVALNPQLWVTLADAMCTFAAPATLVSDAVQGGGFR